ncbi:MAG: carbohydrate ABC transporter permease [Candidatus Izemoplasmatales bacterium]|nr:carbohydrate ABC transporter permease [Candidatus Izemoplasmatales bacterium]
MKNQLFAKTNRLEWITVGIDLLFVILYIVGFLYFFGIVELPMLNDTTIDLANLDQNYVYQTFLGELESPQLNGIISLLVIFMTVSVPLLVIHFKKVKNIIIYEVSPGFAATKFFYGVINLLSLNPFSAALRFYNTFVALQLAKGYGFKGFLKSIGPWLKKVTAKKVQEEDNEDDEDTLLLKKNIRRQTAVHATRMTLTYFFLIVMAVFIIIPFYWMIVTSLKDFYDSTVNPNPSIFIGLQDMQWVNYKAVLQELNFGVYIKNTLIVAFFSTIGTIITTIFASYAFAKLEFKGRETIFSIMIMTMMIPGELYIITNFITVSKNGFGWIGGGAVTDTYFLAMIVPFMTSISYIFFLRQNFKQIPESLYKAARVDGCSDFKYLTRVMIPIASPTIFTITILNVIGSWNAFIWPRLITAVGGTEGQNYWLISVALRDANFNLPGGDRIMYNLQIAASALVTVPLILVFFTFRKYIMNGIGRSGTKG